MCGICGIVRIDRGTVDPGTLKKMNNEIVHRGPDGDGYHFSPGIGLGMRRLAVIDLNTGDQPISNEDKTVWIVFNGEIFNFPELREALMVLGHSFYTQTDTECIVHLYEEYGDDCVHHLRGQFAFALWDLQQERLLVVRDRLGQKPLFYTFQDDRLYFCSELSALRNVLRTVPEIDLTAIDLYLSLQYIPDPNTPYMGVY